MLNRKTLLAATAIVALSSAAYAQDETNWYAGAGFGANWLDDESIAVTAGPPTATAVGAEFDPGWVMTGAVGHRWNQWRLEFELAYRDNSSEDLFAIPGPLADTMFADVGQFSQMVNLLWDLPIGDNMALTIGGGMGGVQVQVDAGGLAGLSTISMDDDDYVFAYQGIAGLSIDISDNMELFAEYRYFATDEVSVQGVLSPAASVISVNEELESHSALFGVRYHFLEAAAPPPQAQPEPVEPARPKTYIVFFDFNKSNLTSEAQSVVAEAAEAFKATGSVRIQVTGHTDTVGSSSYNQRLSERRAATVRAELVRLGVAGDVITTEGRGFSDPMVPTGPGVREPQNRRAVIDLQ
jgi:outer membrane protein OmpA-like peptidoglycan-associated protein